VIIFCLPSIEPIYVILWMLRLGLDCEICYYACCVGEVMFIEITCWRSNSDYVIDEYRVLLVY
jgi:hypothetical protein